MLAVMSTIRIEANTAELIKLVKEKHRSYEKGFKEATVRYFDKVGEYVDYVQACYSGGATEPLKQPPMPPTYYGHDYENTLNFLAMHSKKTLPLTRVEYNSVVENVNGWISVGVSGYGYTMSGLSYTTS